MNSVRFYNNSSRIAGIGVASALVGIAVSKIALIIFGIALIALAIIARVLGRPNPTRTPPAPAAPSAQIKPLISRKAVTISLAISASANQAYLTPAPFDVEILPTDTFKTLKTLIEKTLRKDTLCLSNKVVEKIRIVHLGKEFLDDLTLQHCQIDVEANPRITLAALLRVKM
jgi:hypothetical protein